MTSRLRLAAIALSSAAFLNCAMAEDFKYSEWTIAQAQKAFGDGTLTSEALVEAYLARIGTYSSSYGVFTSMNPTALDDARAVDKRRAAGEKLGPLAGIPIAVKESMDVAGLPSTAGWAPLSKKAGGVDLIPPRDAPIIARLRAAGAIILGKTNIPAFSGDGTRADSSWMGPTYNAFDRKLAPGASSSGSATAVSGNLAMLATAEETGGSIQDPSGAQGIVGIRPTFALVPNVGVAPVGGSTRDVMGPFARTVRDAALMLDVMAGYDAEDPKTVAAMGRVPKGGYESGLKVDALKGKRIGLYGPGWRAQALTPDTQKLYDSAIADLTKQGAVAVDDPFAGSTFASLTPQTGRYDDRGQESVAYDFEKYLNRFGDKAPIHSLATMKAVIGKTPFDEGQPLARWSKNPVAAAALADPDAPPDFSQFRAVREGFLDVFDAVMDEKNLDALVFPQMAEETPALDGKGKIRATTVSEIDIMGLPAVIVPGGYYPDGAPFALIFVGRMWSEADVIGMAYAYEQATKHRHGPELAAK
jgi:Asp-tRNA(Asn)/Glu-tRNA(Gln) amidotransferase A subunit family amidase